MKHKVPSKVRKRTSLLKILAANRAKVSEPALRERLAAQIKQLEHLRHTKEEGDVR